MATCRPYRTLGILWLLLGDLPRSSPRHGKGNESGNSPTISAPKLSREHPQTRETLLDGSDFTPKPTSCTSQTENTTEACTLPGSADSKKPQLQNPRPIQLWSGLIPARGHSLLQQDHESGSNRPSHGHRRTTEHPRADSCQPKRCNSSRDICQPSLGGPSTQCQ